MNPLKSVMQTILAGFILAAVIAYILHAPFKMNLNSLIVWLHVFVGIIWIGLLYYFNFVQVPGVNESLTDTGGPGPAAINKYIAPRALIWFRYGALLTWLTGASAIEIIYGGGSLTKVFMLQGTLSMQVLGVGAWLGTIMLFNVWGLIWPNQKKILGFKPATDKEKAKAKVVALMASRTNTLLSIPMLMCMIGGGAGHGLPF